MVKTVVIGVVLLMVAIETTRGFFKWRTGGLRDAFLGLAMTVACFAYLVRDQVQEQVLLAFVLLGTSIGWGGFLIASRRDSVVSRESLPLKDLGGPGGRKLAWVLAILGAADALAIVLIVAAIGQPALVIGSFVAINIAAAAIITWFRGAPSERNSGA
jgi:hypothetical protein